MPEGLWTILKFKNFKRDSSQTVKSNSSPVPSSNVEKVVEFWKEIEGRQFPK
jgi:hypothetical protein